MQRLSGADASFVYGETPGSHLHLGTLAVLDPSTAPDGFNVERLRSLIEARAGLLGPFLRRWLRSLLASTGRRGWMTRDWISSAGSVPSVFQHRVVHGSWVR